MAGIAYKTAQLIIPSTLTAPRLSNIYAYPKKGDTKTITPYPRELPINPPSSKSADDASKDIKQNTKEIISHPLAPRTSGGCFFITEKAKNATSARVKNSVARKLPTVISLEA